MIIRHNAPDKWSGRNLHTLWGSNQRPLDYKSSTLSIELSRQAPWYIWQVCPIKLMTACDQDREMNNWYNLVINDLKLVLWKFCDIECIYNIDFFIRNWYEFSGLTPINFVNVMYIYALKGVSRRKTNTFISDSGGNIPIFENLTSLFICTEEVLNKC